MTKAFFFSLSLLAALPFGISSQADTVPGFGNVSFAKGAWWYSDFGLIAFADEGRNVSRAFSSSLGVSLATDGSGVYSREFGKITPSGEPGWVWTEKFGWVHFATGELDYGLWIWAQRIGWIRHASVDGGTIFWIPQIQSWGQVQEDGSFYSFDYRRLTPTDDPAIYVSEIFGPVRIGEQKGWLNSATYGLIWAARESAATAFYSSARDEWLSVGADNAIWSPSEGFLAKGGDDGAPADFDINNVVWLHTDVSSWPVTSELTDITIRDGHNWITYDAGTRWRGFLGGTAYFNATPVVLVKIGGTYYGGAWQWYLQGSNTNVKQNKYIWEANKEPIKSWRPSSGEVIGFMVTTPSLLLPANPEMERTNIVWIEWP